MTIRYKASDMFSEPVQALVNTVNCVGVMGKGVALEFKKRWPANFKAYKKICDAKELVPGNMFIFDTDELFAADGPRYLVNFPTKAHWRSKSKISYVEDGLDALRLAIEEYEIESIGIPPLGCGNGGLEWADVKPLIEAKLGDLPNVDVVVFGPKSSADQPEHVNAKFEMTFERAILLKCLSDLEFYFDGAFDRISMQKITYFLQAVGVGFNLEFKREARGPYSNTLKTAFVSLEERGMISGFSSVDKQSHVTRTGCAIADEFINSSPEYDDGVIDSVSKLIQGYESSYGLELLASVHWLAHHEKHSPVEKIIGEMANWNEGKRNKFSEESIRFAYLRLQEDGLLN